MTDKIDTRVASLVATMNRIPLIQTCSSCGGHEAPTGSQVPANEFSISFYVKECKAGWAALEFLTECCQDVSKSIEERVDVTVWVDGGLRWDIHGYDVEPDALADMIEQRLP